MDRLLSIDPGKQHFTVLLIDLRSRCILAWDKSALPSLKPADVVAHISGLGLRLPDRRLGVVIEQQPACWQAGSR
jgi:hypothetical protein